LFLALLLTFTTPITPSGRQSATYYGIADLGEFVVPTAVMDYGFPSIAGYRWVEPDNAERASFGAHGWGLNTWGTLGGSNSFARATNGSITVGEAQTVQQVYHAFAADYQGQMSDLGTLGGPNSMAYGLNDAGVIVGASETPGTNAPTVAFIYRDGAMSSLDVSFGGSGSAAYDVNNVGQIVGHAAVSSPTGQTRAFLHDNGTTTNLGSLGGSSIAYAINDHGIVVGSSVLKGTADFHAFRWESGVMQDLGTLGGPNSRAAAINTAGTIGGWAEIAPGKKRAVIWRDGQIVDVNSLIPPGSDWVLEEVTGVGFRDALVGWGRRADGRLRGFLLTPPMDIELSFSSHFNDEDTNIPVPHEAGRNVLLGVAFNNWDGHFPATGLGVEIEIDGPYEIVSYPSNCTRNGQRMTCDVPTFDFSTSIFYSVRATAPGELQHTARLTSTEIYDPDTSNNSGTETNVAVSLASLSLAETTVTGGSSVLARATLTSPSPTGGARVQLTSNRPDVATVPSEFDVLPWSNGGLWREFYVSTKPVSQAVTVQISGRYGLHTVTQALTVLPEGTSFPYHGSAHVVPGIIQAENYDGGGQNVGYNDTSGRNEGDQYRADDVDIEQTTDSGGGYNVGWMAQGEWLQYTVNVATSGDYRLDLRVAANGVGGSVHVEFDGVNKTGGMTIPNTGGWQAWRTISAPVTLASGTQRMRIKVDAAGPTGVVGNLNFIRLIAMSTGPQSTPYTGTPVALPGVVQAENFDNGGADVAYRDTSAGNSGGSHRSTDVDIQPTTDAGGGYNVGWMAVGEWLVYSVNVPSAGSYRLDLRVAANGAGGRLHVEFDGTDKTGAVVIPNTGGWQSWTTVSVPVTLSAGTQRMRVVIDSAGATGVVGNLNFIQIAATGAPPTPSDIVIYASDIDETSLHGSWSKGIDAASPGGVMLRTPDAGFAVANSPLASPTHAFDMDFTPVANTPYTLWLRLKALNDSKYNDAVWVQFDGAHANGQPIYQVGSTSGLLVNLATDAGASSLVEWGWVNGAYWLNQPTTFTFPAGSTQRMRIQVREDGVQLDQVVLSPKRYLSTPPGDRTNDTTIVPKP
jgi:probable HAF family extracellular repeat protein